MPDSWFEVPETTVDNLLPDQGDDTVPDYVDGIDGIDNVIGNAVNDVPPFVLHVYGDQTALDELASQIDVTEVSEADAIQKLQNSESVHSDAGPESFSL